MLILFLFGFIVFALAGALQVYAVWKRRRQQREEIERAMRAEFPDEQMKK
ncbi:MAG: hypothetical protein IPM12_15225 [Flavobacteriales bacterium]|jgi:hypothetical protein|nr:hypothetical protein [Flavobacteriales bacterium]MBK9149155.1 hypothetical protein [Flavobacteriales bacterium]